MKDIRDHARAQLKGFCKVCKRCDGRACTGEVPGMGGIGTGHSFQANLKALDAIQLHMRLIHDVVEPDISTSLLGFDLSIPVFAAPIGGIKFNMGGKISEDEYVESKLKGCITGGIIGSTGDGVPPFIIDASINGLQACGGQGIPFIKPWESDDLQTKLDRAAKCGCRVAGMDIDAAGLVTLAQMGKPVSPKSPAQLKDIIDGWDGDFIVKGVMTVEDAELAFEAGASAIVVSNHGGRVLDGMPGTATALPAIRKAVGSKTVLVDGGVRNGVDILKMIAIGADAVMIGRPFSVAVMGGGEEGVVKYIDTLKTELKSAMVLTGCKSISEVSDSILVK
ncbi:MAG: alpha-hydroxy-acid oxidizing protein [Desulfovibrio sp.]